MAGKNALMKFSRYETHLKRCLYRAMEEFRSLQNVRLRRVVDQESPNEQIASLANDPSLIVCNVGEASVLHNNNNDKQADIANCLE
jgi:hypothetical protein